VNMVNFLSGEAANWTTHTGRAGGQCCDGTFGQAPMRSLLARLGVLERRSRHPIDRSVERHEAWLQQSQIEAAIGKGIIAGCNRPPAAPSAADPASRYADNLRGSCLCD